MNEFTLIAVRHGIIEDNNQVYANLKVLQTGLEKSDGYVGLKTGKMKVNSSALAQQIIDSVKTLPCQIKLKLEIDFGSGEKMTPVVTGFSMS